MADKKTVAGKIVKETFDRIYNDPAGQDLMGKVVFSFRGLEPKRTDVKVGHIAAGFSAVRKLDSLYREGLGSKVTVELANMAKDELDLLPSNVQARFLGSLEKLGGQASMPVGPGRAGLKMLDFNNPKTAKLYYDDDKTNVVVDANEIRARRNLGKAGPFHMSIEGGVTKRGDARAMLRGRMPLAKGGHVKQYSNSPRKPRLK